MTGIITIPTQYASPASRLDNERTWGFQSYQELQAAATPLDGFTLRDDFSSLIGKYVRSSDDIRLWPMLRKLASDADLNREMVEGPDPQTGFVSKLDLNAVQTTNTNFQPHDLTDPGQQNKALGGRIKIGHYAASLWEQQGQPYGKQLAQKTEKLISSVMKTLERALFWGNASTNPLEFNGLEAQMAPGHTFRANVTHGDVISKKLRGVVRLSISDEEILRGVTHIFTTALGVELIEDQTDAKLEYTNADTIRPGLRVPSIVTHRGITPIVDSPFLRDTPDQDGFDWVHYYLLDMNSMSWKGVVPKGGQNTYEPQIFDITKYISGNFLTEERLCIAYGTLHVLNRGQGVWKLSVAVPEGTIGSI